MLSSKGHFECVGDKLIWTDGGSYCNQHHLLNFSHEMHVVSSKSNVLMNQNCLPIRAYPNKTYEPNKPYDLLNKAYEPNRTYDISDLDSRSNARDVHANSNYGRVVLRW